LHALQADDPSELEYDPALQEAQKPSTAYVPNPHFWHALELVAATAVEYLPPGQVSQFEAPSKLEYVPASQLTHGLNPSGWHATSGCVVLHGAFTNNPGCIPASHNIQ
jgi:hypothetical protein